MIHRCHGVLWPANAKSAFTKLGEGLRRRHLVYEMEIDIEDRRRRRRLRPYHMGVPHLVEQCAGRTHATSVGSAIGGSTNVDVASAIRSRSVTTFCRSASDLRRSKMLIKR